MKILSLEFTPNWSWGLVVNELIQELRDLDITKREYQDKSDFDDYDIILSQQISGLKNIPDRRWRMTVCRLGGNRTFDNSIRFRNEMSSVFAIIATNKKLYEIAKQYNPRTYLIPNGIDLEVWKPNKKAGRRPFIVGFAGNITGDTYRDYKGYDYVEQACKELGVELGTALYGDKQIPHEEMMDEFYYTISCLVLPTKGEGSSNVIMESLACGVPVITTREAGFHGEMLKDGKNVLFCERSVESVKKCIERLRNDRLLRSRMGKAGREFAEKYHDVREIAKQYRQIFEECYAYNKRTEAEVKEESNTIMKVRMKKSVYDNGFLEKDIVVKMDLHRIKQLGNEFVEVIGDVSEG